MTAPIIIIGATGGVGSALARQLRAEGRALHLIARDAGRLSLLAAETGASFAQADVCDEAGLAAAIRAAGGSQGIGGLAYCVGSIQLKPLAKALPVDFIEAFRLNAVGAAMAVQAAAPGLALAGGAVVLFSTVALAQGFANHAIIGAAKGAVQGLVLALAAELAPRIRVNAIAPSLMRTAMAESLTKSEPMAKAIAQLHAIPRLGEPEDAAAAAAFLLSDKASWMTGQILAVDGGRSTLRGKG